MNIKLFILGFVCFLIGIVGAWYITNILPAEKFPTLFEFLVSVSSFLFWIAGIIIAIYSTGVTEK